MTARLALLVLGALLAGCATRPPGQVAPVDERAIPSSRTTPAPSVQATPAAPVEVAPGATARALPDASAPATAATIPAPVQPVSEAPAQPAQPDQTTLIPGTTPVSPPPSTATAPTVAPAPDTGPPLAPPSSGPAATLVASAEAQTRAGHPERAVASLERAVKIAPRDAGLWHRLARARLDAGQPAAAASLAAKSNSLAASDRALQARNWRLIAAARAALGDAQGAREARERASGLGG